jgi:putative adhesin
MRKSLLPLLFLLPMAAFAASPECQHSQPRDLQLDLAGVKAVVFDIENHDLAIQASANAKAELKGQACASDAKLLEQLKLTQRKSGDKLYVNLHREVMSSGLFFGKNYAYLKLAGTLPDNVTVQLKVGSGDARVSGASVVSADVGSGDVKASDTRGLVAAKVGSGDIEVDGAGSLQVISVASGDLVAKKIRGPVKVGSISSGDFSLDGATGDVEIGSIGSGDAEVRNVSGDLSVDSVGSGDIDASGIRGDFTLRKKGNGSASHKDIGGRVSVPSED